MEGFIEDKGRPDVIQDCEQNEFDHKNLMESSGSSAPIHSSNSSTSYQSQTKSFSSHLGSQQIKSSSPSQNPVLKSSSSSPKINESIDQSQLNSDTYLDLNSYEVAENSLSISATSSTRSYPKLPNNPSSSSIISHGTSIGSEKRKKKSWVKNALNPTYKSRCEDLLRNFPGLPQDETLIVDYSCALQKDILVHGRLYVTTNFLCFYANIFRWETAVTVRWKEVTAMTKEKTALVIPNAILICTGNDKLFFTSFAARDKSHMMLFRLWQNALLDSPASQTEIFSWVQSVYGEHSSRYSDYTGYESNDGGSSHSFDGQEMAGSAPSLIRPRLYSNIDEEEESKLSVNFGTFLPQGANDITRNTKSSGIVSDHSDLSETDSRHLGKKQRSLTSPAIVSTDILTYEVWRQSKDAREIVCKNFKINIDELFTLLFTNSKFFYDFQAERKTFDIVQCPWKHSDNCEDKFREVSYTLNLNHSIGPKTSRATEVQTMRSNSVPGHIYNVDVETTNADVPYADTFFVATHYCVVKVNDEESMLTVLCDIKYKKPPWGLVKSFIDKNCWAGIEEHFAALTAGLDREIENRIEQEAGKEAVTKKKTRRLRNQRRTSASSESVVTNVPIGVNQYPQVHPQHNSMKLYNEKNEKSLKHDQSLFLVLLSMLGLLCILNIFLIYKIWGLENKMLMKTETETVSNLIFDKPSTSSDWLDILQKQEILHNQDLANWKTAVEAAARLLHQTENSMGRLNQAFTQESNRRLLKELLKNEETFENNPFFDRDIGKREL